MANRIILFIALAVVTSATVYSQKFELRPEISYGTFNMNDLKVLQNYYTSSNGVDIRSLSSFPAYWGYGISIISSLKSGLGIGLSSEFYSTGGRNYYADYSGSYTFDLLTESVNLGALVSFRLKPAARHSIILEVTQGAKFSELRVKEKLIINQEIEEDNNNFKSTSYWLKPVIRYEFSISGPISAGAYFGAEFNPQSYLHLEDRNDIYLTDYTQHKISINWSGIRFGLHCSISIFNLNKDLN